MSKKDLHIVAGDQGSRQGLQCGKSTLTGEPGSIVSVGASWDMKNCPLGVKQRVDPLDK